jgi:hypothetical protein
MILDSVPSVTFNIHYRDLVHSTPSSCAAASITPPLQSILRLVASRLAPRRDFVDSTVLVWSVAIQYARLARVLRFARFDSCTLAQ